MIETFKKTFIIGLLVILCFLISMLMIKQSWMEDELMICKDKIWSLEEDIKAISMVHYHLDQGIAD